jgi:hypothetical protein
MARHVNSIGVLKKNIVPDPYQGLTDPASALFVSDIQVFCSLLFEGTFISIGKDKKFIKKSQSSRN